jgi:cyclopropane fatty-acyl-phospholipid synthase-like methyltransferase
MDPADDGPSGHTYLDFNAPLSDDRAARLISSLHPLTDARVLDLGCGWGELLLRLLATEPTAHGTGVDNDDEAIARARGNATARGLDPRVRWHADEVAGWRDAPVDVVLAVGVSHIWGGTASMLSALTDRVKPGGRVLVGDAFWERPLTTRERVGLGVDLAELTTVSSLAEIVDTAIDRGYRLLAVSTATLDEWDDFESRYCAGRERWLLDHPDDARAKEARAIVDEHRDSWLRGYRGVLGFGYLTLAAPPEPARA